MAALLVDALEHQARRLGGRRLVLQTGDRQPDAVAVHRRTGFAEIPLLDHYLALPDSFCMAKSLGPDDRAAAAAVRADTPDPAWAGTGCRS